MKIIICFICRKDKFNLSICHCAKNMDCHSMWDTSIDLRVNKFHKQYTVNICCSNINHSLWCFKWCLRLGLEVHLFPHWSQQYGFSLVCCLVWSSRLCFTANDFSHLSHLKGFSPVWSSMCFAKLIWSLNNTPHIWHKKDLPLVWIFIWTPKHCLEDSKAPHIVHLHWLLAVWVIIWLPEVFALFSKKCRRWDHFQGVLPN